MIDLGEAANGDREWNNAGHNTRSLFLSSLVSDALG